ncbi:antiviral reverse transcriptase Drt3a [Chromohalobacter japonicus]|uniref:antiviral reverse transcriptase Drt3a n=1 Tax=Chromohalobacter japonicus TaxID=223900 RepID=UPI0009E5B442|nr:antiviral reverse transcriptase Drt3a [Chromohalobacter japonicus]
MSRIQAFNDSTLARHFAKEDFYNDNSLSDDEYRRSIVEEAVEESEKIFPRGVEYNSFFIGNKKSFSLSSLPQRLVVRACVTHLKRAFPRYNKSRSQIARELRVFLADGTPYNIYRLDIKSFFENINKEELGKKVDILPGLSMHTKKIVRETAEFFDEKENVCVPRGVETSSILSDLYLQGFDSYAVSRDDVFFYSRFVDDILVITSSEVEDSDFKSDLFCALPEGLFFNNEKTELKRVPKRKKAGSLYNGNNVASFDYLGFRFSVIDFPLPIERKGGVTRENAKTASAVFRKVIVDLSPNKVKRIKDKLCKAFYAYSKTNNYSLLRDRLRFLTTNREFVKKDGSTIIPVGVYYNSSACDFPSEQLSHLDDFMRYLLFGSRGRLPRLHTSNLTLKQKKELIKFSFSYGFNCRVHKRFSYDRLAEIVKVWK